MKTNQLQINIPNGWERKKLSEIGRALIGLTYSPDDVVETGGTLVFRSSNIKSGKIDYSDQVRVSAKISEKNFVKEGDILICARNGSRNLIGKNAYISKKDEGNVFGAFMTIFRAKNPRYIYQLFQSSLYKKEIEMDLGPTINQVTTGNLSRFKFNFPNFAEQNRIVSVLEAWDKAIENLNTKIEIKKQIKKGLMQDLLTGKKRLSGFEDKWITLTIGDVAEFINGYTFKSGSYVDDGKNKIITIANVQDGFMFIDEPKTINELPSNISEEQILKKGDILISMTGNVGRVCVVDHDNCLLNQRVGKIVAKNINKELLYLFLYDRRFLYQMIGSAQGGAQANLSTEDIKEYVFDLPKTKEEQKAIADILTTADKEIKELENKLLVIKDQKKYLLNNLITGTIRTPENLSIKS